MRINARVIEPLEVVYTDLLQGHFAARRITGSDLSPLTPVLLLVGLFAFGIRAFVKCGLDPPRWVAFVRRDLAMILIFILTGYTLLVGCLMEYGENVRFKFMVEQVTWIFLIALAFRKDGASPAIDAAG